MPGITMLYRVCVLAFITVALITVFVTIVFVITVLPITVTALRSGLFRKTHEPGSHTIRRLRGMVVGV